MLFSPRARGTTRPRRPGRATPPRQRAGTCPLGHLPPKGGTPAGRALEKWARKKGACPPAPLSPCGPSLNHSPFFSPLSVSPSLSRPDRVRPLPARRPGRHVRPRPARHPPPPRHRARGQGPGGRAHGVGRRRPAPAGGRGHNDRPGGRGRGRGRRRHGRRLPAESRHGAQGRHGQERHHLRLPGGRPPRPRGARRQGPGRRQPGQHQRGHPGGARAPHPAGQHFLPDPPGPQPGGGRGGRAPGRPRQHGEERHHLGQPLVDAGERKKKKGGEGNFLDGDGVED